MPVVRPLSGGDAPLRVLWIKTELLHPVTVGGRIRTYHMLRELRRRHHVTYLALDDGSGGAAAIEKATEYCHELIRIPVRPARRGSVRFALGLAASLATSLPYVAYRARSRELRRALTERVSRGDIDLVICDFLFPASNVPDGLGVPIVLFQHNVEAAIWRRHSEVRSNPLARAFFREQWRRVFRFECQECRRFDRVIAVSDQDRRKMEEDYRAERVDAVPTGVDTAFFTAAAASTARPGRLVFTGAMDWLPNEDAMAYYVDSILPLIRRAMPDAHLTIVGRNPSARVRALADGNPAVTVTGSVPDVRPYLEEASVFVVPLRIGGGTRLKIYEALAMDRAVVSTPIGAEGLDTVDGETIAIAESPEAFADSVVRLLRDPAAAAALGKRGGDFVRANYGWERVSRAFEEICARTLGEYRGRRR